MCLGLYVGRREASEKNWEKQCFALDLFPPFSSDDCATGIPKYIYIRGPCIRVTFLVCSSIFFLALSSSVSAANG